MKNSAPELPAVGRGFLKPGDNVAHFYYSAEEQCRFCPLLQDAVDRGLGVVVAGVGERHPLMVNGVRAPRLQRRRNLLRLQVTANLHATISTLAHATEALLQWTREVRVIADFDGLVSREAILENEAELSRAMHAKRVITISQYDGNAFPASVTMEQFHTHVLTLVGTAFYSENRNCMTPEEYLRVRQQKIQASARGATA